MISLCELSFCCQCICQVILWEIPRNSVFLFIDFLFSKSNYSLSQGRHRHFASEDNSANGEAINHIGDAPDTSNENDNRSEESSLDESDIDFLADAEIERDVFMTKTFIYVSDLARKSPKALAKKSSMYHWNLMTIGIEYCFTQI